MKSGMSEFAMSQRVFSGVQPTGQMHLGNYLGALQAFARMQHTHECLFCIVDLHAITLPQNPAQLAANTRCTAAAFIAAGVDPEQAVIYPQSAVPMHTEMGWVLSCVARMGWLERMTQFKDKAGKDSERASVGLFAYPVLQAADILGFRATHVPVGEDQKQHLELARDIAARFNKEYGPSDMFPLPEPVIGGFGTRVMSLKDGQKKMSKSDPSEASRINLGDDADTIARKIRRARTDADPLPERFAQLQARPEAANLVRIFAALSAEEPDAILTRFAGQGFSHFKQELAELAVESLTPVGTRFVQIMEDLTALDQTLQAGAERAHALSAPIMQDVRAKLGFWPEGALV